VENQYQSGPDHPVWLARLKTAKLFASVARNSACRPGSLGTPRGSRGYPSRLSSEASFAALCGVSPVDASSGASTGIASIVAATAMPTVPCE